LDNYGFEVERQVGGRQSEVGGRQSEVGSWEIIGFVEGSGNSILPRSYKFTDKNLIGGSLFKYRLKQIDTDGTFEYSDEIEVEIIPAEFALYQNYPNPFNPSTKIRYQLPRESKVIIKLYDILGAEVRTLLDKEMEPGVYEVILNAAQLPSGIYIYRIVAVDPESSLPAGRQGSGQGFVETKKMLLIK
jgi:hypothetical protein